MNKNQIYNLIKLAGFSASSIIANHYGSKYLDKWDTLFKKTSVDESTTLADENSKLAAENTTLAAENTTLTAENTRLAAENTKLASENLESTKTYLDSIKELIKISREDCIKMKEKGLLNDNTSNSNLDKAQETIQNVENDVNKVTDLIQNSSGNKDIGFEIANRLKNNISELGKILEEIKKSGNNFLPDFIWDIDLNKIYQYLDSLTLVQEGALLHIVVLITMLVTLFNILGAFFGNEIIKYFNIEERLPWLSNILKIRAKLQRYYLMWNIFILFILCLGALAINILVFITG